MSDLIKAMNPTTPLTDAGIARKAAQASAVGMLVGAVNTVAEGWYAANGGAEASQRMLESLTGQAPTAEEIASAAQFGLIGTAVVVVLHLVLAGVQWKKPNSVLPILFLVLVVWGLGSALLGLISAGQLEAIGATPRPMWLTVVTLVTLAIAAVLHIAGIRGSSALGKFQNADAS